MTSQEALATVALQNFLPHRAPMVWIDEVGPTSADGGSCSVTLKPDGLYLTGGVLRPSCLIEFIAQGFGYTAAAHKVRSGQSDAPMVQRAFLVAVTQCQLSDTSKIGAGARLTVTLSDFKNVGPIQLFKGVVTTEAGETLAVANLKVFSE